MRWALVSVAALLAACEAEQVPNGRYACVYGGPIEQCPGQWRCGFENYCHAVDDTSVAWRCEADEHCEAQWKCGLSQNGDAGECHSPDAGAAYVCSDNRHCTAGWHCGQAQRCYDRNAPLPHVCRADAGDCADGWRCGLDGRCQDRAKGGAYLCVTDAGIDDSWCEQQWRCSPEGQCLDPQLDALGQPALLAVESSAQINPLASTSPIERLSLSPVYDTGPGAGLSTIAWVQDGLLKAQLHDPVAVGPVTYPLGPWEGMSGFAVTGSRGERYFGATQIAEDTESRIFLTQLDGGIATYILGSDAGDLGATNYFPATRVKVGTAHGNLSPRVLTFTDVPDFFESWLGARDRDIPYAEFWEDLSGRNFTEHLDGGNRLIDIASVRGTDPMNCIFAVDRRGMWLSQMSVEGWPDNAWGFEPVHLPPFFTNEECSPAVPSANQIVAIASHGRSWLALSSTRADGGDPRVSLIDLEPMWTQPTPALICTTLMGFPCQAATRVPMELRMEPCAVCTGGKVLDFALVAGGAALPKIEVRCGNLDGGTAGFVTVAPRADRAQCDRITTVAENGLFGRPQLVGPEQPVPNHVGWGSHDGFIWAGPSAGTAKSWIFDRAASTVVRPTDAGVMAFTRDFSATLGDDGLMRRPGSGVLMGVARRPAWLVDESRSVFDVSDVSSVGDARLIGVVGESVTPFLGPFAAAQAESGAAKVLVVAAAGSVFAADMSAAIANQQTYVPLPLRVVSSGPITSLALSQQPPAGLYLRGYVVTPNGVQRLTAQTSTRYVFDDVSLPAMLQPLEVWFDGDRGRVGFTDGTVYSLPSRVPISAPLAEEVVDYAQACGQQLVLGPSGLHRLEPSAGSTVGQWKPIALPAGFADGGFANGRAHGVGDGVYLFTRLGEAARVTFADCPSP